ncbi:hypothetical protein D3C73_1215530 [compost metagenome]
MGNCCLNGEKDTRNIRSQHLFKKGQLGSPDRSVARNTRICKYHIKRTKSLYHSRNRLFKTCRISSFCLHPKRVRCAKLLNCGIKSGLVPAGNQNLGSFVHE